MKNKLKTSALLLIRQTYLTMIVYSVSTNNKNATNWGRHRKKLICIMGKILSAWKMVEMRIREFTNQRERSHTNSTVVLL